ncbi:MAG: hypothetical protein ACJAR0_004716 [Candidatus Azotimanducaceae bacterium]|jgi:hypothetical protein
MNKTEFDHLLACYGADFEHWPIEHRSLAKNALESNPEWQTSLLETNVLDNALDQLTPADHHLAALTERILAATVGKQYFLDRLIHWLIPGEALWRPALVACLPIIVGLSIGLNVDIDEQYTLEEELSFTGLVADLSTLEIQDE